MSVKQFIFFGYFLNKKFILYFANLNYHKIYKIMIKEFKISDILNAVDAISKIEKKINKNEVLKKNSDKSDKILTNNNIVKSYKSEILVLEQMIEQNIKKI